MKKILFLFDAPAHPLLAWFSLVIVYSLLVQLEIPNDLILRLVVQLAAFDCFEIHMIRRIKEKVATAYRKDYCEELDDYTLNEAMARHRKSWKYLLIVGAAIAATFLASVLVCSLVEAAKFLISF